jgi:hypothetical protein
LRREKFLSSSSTQKLHFFSCWKRKVKSFLQSEFLWKVFGSFFDSEIIKEWLLNKWRTLSAIKEKNIIQKIV